MPDLTDAAGEVAVAQAQLAFSFTAGQDGGEGRIGADTAAGLDDLLGGGFADAMGGVFAQMAAEHYEALRGAQIDDLESEARRQLAVADRRTGVIKCCGLHHGEPASCVYAAILAAA